MRNVRVRALPTPAIAVLVLSLAMVIAVVAPTGAFAAGPSTSVSSSIRTLNLSPSPTITGSVKVGSTLTAKTGRWAPGAVSFTYKWWANNVAIVGQTSSGYTVRSADAGKKITVTVTGSAPNYAPVVRSSSPTAPVAVASARTLTATPVPTITGNPAPGATLTAAPGVWSPGPMTITYQWRRDGRGIPNATRSTYLVSASDSGSLLSVTVTGSKAGYASFAQTSDTRRVVPASPARDVVAILGQSNAQGAGWSVEPAIDVVVRGVDQLAGSGPSAGRVIPASEPLAQVTTWADRVGPGSRFGRFLLADAAPDRAVLLVPAAQGSTSLTGDANYTWDPANTTAATNLYTRALTQIDAALAEHAGNRLVAIIWAQGESDAALTDGATYEAKLTVVVDGLRARYGNVPILIGGMVPEWVTQSPQRVAIDTAHRAVAAKRPLVAFVAGVSGQNQEDAIHYNAVGARLMAERCYGSYLGLLRR